MTTKMMTNLLLSVEDGNADGGDDNDDDEQRRYEKSMSNEWMMHVDGNMGQSYSILWRGQILAKSDGGGVEGVHGHRGGYLFNRIFVWMLPKFGGRDTFYECLAMRMRNYMTHCIAMKT